MSDTARGRWLEGLFIILAFAGLAGTWAQIGPYLAMDPFQANVQFWRDTLVNPASTFIVVDIFVLGAAVLIWMFAECRRLGIRPAHAWVYFLGSALIGISFFVPLFLAHRQRRLRQKHASQAAPAATDFIGVAVLLCVVASMVGYSLSHMPAAVPERQAASPAVVPAAEHARAQEQRAQGPTANRGIASVKTIGTVPLANEIPGAGDRILRVRELMFAADGVVAVHQHDTRPGVAYVLEGEMTEFRGASAEELKHGPGSAAFEWTGVTHWWENRSGAPARAIVVDIVPGS